MLEKVLFCDAHFHFCDCISKEADSLSEETTGCSSCHCEKDFLCLPSGYIFSYGIHPLNPCLENIAFLEKLLSEKKLSAIGECGFDLFTKEAKASLSLQKEVFEAQMELALQKNMPLVIHGRKANEILFSYSKEFKKLPSVLFHSFMGSFVEAESLIKRGINCYFSFGKQIFNNNKNVIDIVKRLPLENLLLETDSPFQFLKGEQKTNMNEIRKIYEGAFSLKKQNLPQSVDFAGFCEILKKNYMLMYRISTVSGGNQ